jgi:TP901 family phage tail tape measure protein
MATAFNAQLNVQLNAQSLNTASKEIRQSLGRITGSASEFQKSLDASTARVFAFGATTLVINGITQSFKALVTTTIDVEKRLVEINSIFGGTASQFAAFRDTIFDVAKSTGQSFDVVADGAAEFARQGLSATETAKRLEAALILTRVSGLDSVKSVNALTSAINGFTSAGLTAAQVTNKLVAVDTAFAVSAQDLAEGFSRAGSTAEDAGVSFDELLGIITAVQQKTARGGAVIGNALKSVFTRLSRSSTITDLQELGVAIDSSQSGIQKLQALSNALEQISDPSQASAIKELAGGVYQINIVSAALKDLSSQSSIFSQATATSAKATNEAYSKNEQLNKSLAAQINQLIVGVTNLAEKAGQVTFAPLLSNLVGIATKISEFFDKALDPEKGNTFIQGIFKAIGTFISGPGVVLVTGAFLKIISLVAKFAKEGFSSVLQIGTQSEKIKSLQQGIVIALKEDAKFRAAIESGTLTQAGLEQAVNNKIRDRNLLLQQQQQALEAIAKVAIKQGAASFDGARGYLDKRGKPVVTKASGFTPSFKETMAETSAAREHGYTAGKVYNTRLHDGSGGSFKATVNSAETVKTVRGANGKLGTYVIPPNGFAGRGFVPNYAAKSDMPSRLREAYKKGEYIELAGGSLQFTDRTLGYAKKGQLPNGLVPKSQVEKLKNQGVGSDSTVNINKILADRGIKELPTILTPNSSGEISRLKKNFLGDGRDANFKFKAFRINPSGKKSLANEAEKAFGDEEIERFAASKVLPFAQQVSRTVGANPVAPDSIKKVDKVKGFVGAVRGAFGGLFDASISSALDLTSQQKEKDSADFDVRVGALNNKNLKAAQISRLFGSGSLGTGGLGDFKVGLGNTTLDSMVSKTNKEYSGLIGSSLSSKKPRTKASGFVPNFASYVYDSDRIPADKGATLKAILASKAKKNLLIAPSGAGKSTLAAKYGKFLSGASEVPKASEINLLSGAARAKGGGMSKQLESLLDSVNNSGGKVSYLHVKNMEIMKRRMGRASLEGDLRSEKQLKGTKFAPLNQFDFVKAVKSRAKRFEVLNAGEGYVPNFARKELGYGAFGTFSSLGKRKGREGEVGVKAFRADTTDRAVEKEWLTAEYLSKYVKSLEPNLFFPPNLSSYEFAMKKKKVLKPVISDPLAKDALRGEGKADPFGERILSAAIQAASGVKILDLHGGNYTVNKAAQEAIKAFDFSKSYSGQEAYAMLKGMTGAKFGAFDVGVNSLSETATKNLEIIKKRQLAKKGANKAGGFVPNFAGLPRNLSRKITAIQIAKGLGMGLLKQLVEQYLGDGFVDNIEAAGLRKMNPKDVVPFLAELNKPTRSKHQRAFDSALLGDPLMQAQFPQRYRVLQAQIAEQRRLDSAGGGFMPNFSAVGDAIKREKAAGVPSSKIYLDSSPQLKSSRNPMGMMVANSLDEPKGGFQGINRARKEGRNPKTYGAAGGFVPNYATGDFIDDNRNEVIVGAGILLAGTLTILTKAVIQEIKHRKLQAAEDKNTLADAKKLGDARRKELAAIQARMKARSGNKSGVAAIAGGVGGGKQTSSFQTKLGGLNEKMGKVQGALFGVSIAASMLGDKAGQLVGSVIGVVSVVSILLPLLSSAIPILSGLTVVTGGAAIALIGLATAAYFLIDALNRIKAAELEGKVTESKFKTRRDQISVRTQNDFDIAGISPEKRKEMSGTEKEYNKARDVTSRKLDELRQLEGSISIAGREGRTLLGGDLGPQIEAKRKAVEEAQAKQNALKEKVDADRKLKEDAKATNTSNFGLVKEAAAQTGFRGERATAALTASAAAKKTQKDLEAQRVDLEGQRTRLKETDKNGSNKQAIEDLNKQIIELDTSIAIAGVAYTYAGKEITNIADSIRSGGADLSSELKTLKDSFIKETKGFEDAMKVVVEKLRKQGETLDMAKAITPASGEFSERTSNKLELSSLFSQAQSSQANYKSSFSGLKDVFDPSALIVSDAPEKKRQEALAALSASSFSEKDSPTQAELIDRAKAEAIINDTFNKEIYAEQQAASKKAKDNFKNLSGDVASGKLQNDLFTDFAKGGEEAFKKAFQSKFSTTNIEDGSGKELYDKLLEGAKGFKETIEQSYTTALNMQTKISNQMLETGLQLIEAQKNALSNITSTVKGILDGTKVDPTALFQKFEEAAKLLKTGDPKDAQKANKILAGADEQTKAFRDKYGEESLRGLQERAGMTNDMVAKSKSSAVMQTTDFGTIEEIIKNSLSGANQQRLSGAFEEAKADPSKMSEFIDMVNQTFTGRLAEKGKQITGSVTQFDSAGERKRMMQEVDKQLYNYGERGINADTSKSIRDFKMDSGSAENFEKMLKALQDNYGADKGKKIADAYKKAATKKDEFSPEDDAVKGLNERQKALQVELNETTEMVNKFKVAFDGKDGGITTSISALKTAIDDASTGVTGFKTLTQSLSDISEGIGTVLDKVRKDIAELQKGSGK